MKKSLLSIFFALFLISVAFPAYAANIQIRIDNITVASDVEAEIINNRTMVPLRIISENLGVNVNWSDSEVILNTSNMQVILKLNSGIAIKNGEAVPLDVKPYIKNNRTMVPLRFLAETLGCDVNYSNFTVTVNTEPFILDGVKVKALQQEYRMTNSSTVKQITGNAYNKAIYDILLSNRGSRAETPIRYSWMADIDTTGAYYKLRQYDFLDSDNNPLQRFDIYHLVKAHPAETLAKYPEFLIFNVTVNEWNLFNETAIQAIDKLVGTAYKHGFVILQ